MNHKIIKAAARASLNVYKDFDDLGIAKVNCHLETLEGQLHYVIAFKGTDPTVKDWKRNFDMRTINGIKIQAYNSAAKLFIERSPMNELPILVTGHSQGAGEAIAFFMEHCNHATDKCVAFAPPPVLTKAEYTTNCVIVVNDRDCVSYLGGIKFSHPKCETIYFDHKGKVHINLTMAQIFWKSVWRFWRVKERTSDHPMKKYFKLTNSLKGE